MKRIFEAKNEYNSIEIPPELGEVVLSAIDKGNEARRRKSFSVQRFSYIAACAALFVALGVSGALRYKAPVSVEVGMPGAGARMIVEDPSFDTPYSTMASEREREEKRKGNTVEVIYIDEKFASFSVTDEDTENVRYMNVFCSDGKDVALSDLGVFDYAEETQFYISSRDTVVILEGEAYKEVRIER